MIMIVDDSAPMRAIMKRHLQAIGVHHEFCECSDGLEAVDAFHRFRPEWVLMDIKMPKMDGLTATQNIRREFPGARIIIVSNFDDPELRDAAHKSGAEGYVLKEHLSELQRFLRHTA